jgi:ATP-dependent DNA helicase UvrD/PcrA
MLSSKNKIVVACAGSRKTTMLVEKALSLSASRVLITTFTNENLSLINRYLSEKNGSVPHNITVTSWFTVLLQDGIRPYQNFVTTKGRIRGMLFDEMPQSMENASKQNADRYFLTSNNNIHSDRASDFACLCDDRSNGLVIKRLEGMYEHILIDEFQDFSGYDLDLVEKLLRSKISVMLVADPRQATFSTNRHPRNKQYRGPKIAKWIEKQQAARLVSLERLNECYRSNQMICDFADKLFPELKKTISRNSELTGHDGIFFIERTEVIGYVKQYDPIVLRYMKTTDTMNLAAANIRLSKGRTFDRVLIFPTGKWKAYLKHGDISTAGDIIALYIAVTRAKYSVAFVL